MYIAMVGNLNEGWKAYGPYETFEEAAIAHDFSVITAGTECWIMELHQLEVKA